MQEEKYQEFLVSYYKKISEMKNIFNQARCENSGKKQFYNGQYESAKNLQIEFVIGVKQKLGINIYDLTDKK